MIQIKSFVFNPYQENTYVLYDEKSRDCLIVDPGMDGPAEERMLQSFIEEEGLNPVLLLNTHCHIDHVLGNHYVFEQWGLIPQFHKNEVPILVAVDNYAPQMGIRYETSPIPTTFLEEGQNIDFGAHTLKVIFAPGHSPGHVCYFSEAQNFLLGGDVLFRNSIGRTDLPGGNHEILLRSIETQLYTLPEETIVYPGHGPHTTIGFEKKTNPFVRA